MLVQGKPSTLPPSALKAAAIIEAFNPGMRGGQAIAELVLGLIEPSGRLPISVPRHVGQQPVFYNQVRGQHGERYADLTQDPQFVFGEGLSYTSVEYTDLRLRDEAVAPDGVVHAEVTLTNTGTRPALETVQAYVSDLVTSATWADKELKAWRQVQLPAGEAVTVTLEVPAASCSMVTAGRAPRGRARAVRPSRRPQLPHHGPPSDGVHGHRLIAAGRWGAVERW